MSRWQGSLSYSVVVWLDLLVGECIFYFVMITSDCLSENNYNYPIEILLLLMIVLSRLILLLVIVPMFYCVTEVINICTSPAQYSYI